MRRLWKARSREPEVRATFIRWGNEVAAQNAASWFPSERIERSGAPWDQFSLMPWHSIAFSSNFNGNSVFLNERNIISYLKNLIGTRLKNCYQHFEIHSTKIWPNYHIYNGKYTQLFCRCTSCSICSIWLDSTDDYF